MTHSLHHAMIDVPTGRVSCSECGATGRVGETPEDFGQIIWEEIAVSE